MGIIVFWIKKIVARAFFPMPVFFELMAIGATLCIWKKTRRAGIAVCAFAVLLLFVMSQPYVGKYLLKTLEGDFTALDASALKPVSGGYIIGVAGSDFRPDTGFCDIFLIRMQESGRIAADFERRHVDYKIALSIYGADVSIESKRTAARKFYESFGVPATKIVIFDSYKNSREEVCGFAENEGRLIIVSSAFHMPRLMLLAKRGDITALAAPAGNQALSDKSMPLIFIPSAEALNQVQIATYEYLGILEASL